jgi:hypothetical protein
MRAIMYRWLTPIWPMTIVGLLLGALAGGLAAPSVLGEPPSATALIRIDQPVDANQIVTNSFPSPESQQAYLAGEIVYLSSGSFAQAVGNELKSAKPPGLTATQQGQSALVRITTTATSPDQATAALDLAIKIYSGRVQQLASDRTQAAIDAITTVIENFRAAAAADAERNDEVLDRKALEDNLRTLEQQRLSLQSQVQRAPGIQIIEPITAAPGKTDASLLIVGGGMLGAMVALTAVLTWRRRSGVIATVAHVDRQVSPVLLPVVRLGKRAGSYGRSEVSRARTLYGQLPAPRTGEILVVGASRYSGTEVVAKLLYMAAMEHVSVTAMNVVSECANLSSAAVRAKLAALPTGAGQTVIVDGGSVATAPQMLAVAERAGQIVVVVRIGRDVAAEVEVLLHAIRNEDVSVTAICTKGRLATSNGLFAPRRGRSESGRHSLGNRAPQTQAVAAAPLPEQVEWPTVGTAPWVDEAARDSEQVQDSSVPWHANGPTLEDDSDPVGETTAFRVAPSDAPPAIAAIPEDHDHAAAEVDQLPVDPDDLVPATPSDATPEPPADDNSEAAEISPNSPVDSDIPAVAEIHVEPGQQPTPAEAHVNGLASDTASESPTVRLRLQVPEGEQTEPSSQNQADQAEGLGQDAPEIPAAESTAAQTRSFGTGFRQFLQLRGKPGPAQDDQRDEWSDQHSGANANGTPPETPEHRPHWVSLLERRGEQLHPPVLDDARLNGQHDDATWVAPQESLTAPNHVEADDQAHEAGDTGEQHPDREDPDQHDAPSDVTQEPPASLNSLQDRHSEQGGDQSEQPSDQLVQHPLGDPNSDQSQPEPMHEQDNAQAQTDQHHGQYAEWFEEHHEHEEHHGHGDHHEHHGDQSQNHQDHSHA